LDAAIRAAMAKQYPPAKMTEAAKTYHRAAGQSDGEEGLWWQITKLSTLPKPEREVKLIEGRAWRCDFVWFTPKKLVVEIEGGSWIGGRHTRPKGFREDMKKYNALEKLGFAVIRFAPEAVKRGEALGFLEEFFSGSPEEPK
jgi:very-short-patch-repair endonuclease